MRGKYEKLNLAELDSLSDCQLNFYFRQTKYDIAKENALLNNPREFTRRWNSGENGGPYTELNNLNHKKRMLTDELQKRGLSFENT